MFTHEGYTEEVRLCISLINHILIITVGRVTCSSSNLCEGDQKTWILHVSFLVNPVDTVTVDRITV